MVGWIGKGMDELKKFVDTHSHIVFGADDGALSLKEAIDLLKLDRDEGAYADAVCFGNAVKLLGALSPEPR